MFDKKAYGEALLIFRMEYPFYSVLTLETRIANVHSDIDFSRIVPLRDELEIQISKKELSKIHEKHKNDYNKKVSLTVGHFCFQALMVVLKIPSRSKMYRDKKVFFEATCCVIQQMLSLNQIQEHYPEILSFDFHLDTNETLDYYYRKIIEQQDKQENKNQSDENQSGGGNTPDGASESMYEKIMEKWNELDDNLEQSTDIRIKSSKDELEQQLRNHGNKSLSLEVAEILKKLNPKVDWKRHVRLFTNSTVNSNPYLTYQRPSKRFKGQKGRRYKMKSKIIVAVDTSASISNDDLSSFFTEIDSLHLKGFDFKIAEIDVEIQKVYKYSRVLPEKVSGRGGTSFQGIFDYTLKHKFDGLIYFTDGYAPVPENVSNIKTLWVICNSSHITPKEFKKIGFFGKTIKINK